MQRTATDTAVNSKNVPDVLFVDEDGNPIEPGNENVLFFDENGHEIPEEIAQQLLETGKYLDSRELYHSTSATESQIGFISGKQQKQQQHQPIRHDSSSMSSHRVSNSHSQSHAIALAEAQARIFAEAQVQLKRREEELAQIEADANRESSRLKELIEHPTYQQHEQELQQQIQYHIHLQQKQQQQQQQHDFNKSISSTDVEKSQSLRRVPMPPPKKHSDSDTSSFHNRVGIDQSGTSLYSFSNEPTPKATQQVYDLAQLITNDHNETNNTQAQNQSKYISSDDEDYEYAHGGESTSNAAATATATSASYQEVSDDYSHQVHRHSHHRLSPQEHQYQSEYDEDAKKSYTTNQMEEIIFNQHQQLENERRMNFEREQEELQRRQQEIIDQVLKVDQSRPTSGLYMSDRGESVLANEEDDRSTTHAGHQNQHHDETIITTSASSPFHRQLHSKEQTINSQGKTYKLGTLKLVGHLRGNSIIRDSSKIYEIDLKELEKFYDGDETLVSNNGDLDANLEGGVSEENNNNNKKSEEQDFSDIMNGNTFKDEMIELDYGAIDAYTAALNAHLEAERNNEPAPTGLRYASHILTSNHAMFLENQLFLGDAFFSTGISREVSLLNTREKEVSALGKPEKDVTPTPTRSESNVGHAEKVSYKDIRATEYEDENDPYSRSNSFGSGIDLQSQPGYCVSAADLNSANIQPHPSANRHANSNSNVHSRSNIDADLGQRHHSHIFSTNSKNNMNQTQSHYRSQNSYLNMSNNTFAKNQAQNLTLKSSSHNLNNATSNSRINYSTDSYPNHIYHQQQPQQQSNHGYYGNSVNINTSNSGIYNINALIAQYSQ